MLLAKLKQLQKTINQHQERKQKTKLERADYFKNQVKVKQKLAKDTLANSPELGLKPSKPNFPLPELSPQQMRSRQNYLNAKQKVLKSNSFNQHIPKESGAYHFAFDVEVAKSLKSQSWSTDDITATLSQSDYAHELFQKDKNDHYRHRMAKYIYSVGKKAGLTFDHHLDQNQLPHRQKKSQSEIEL